MRINTQSRTMGCGGGRGAPCSAGDRRHGGTQGYSRGHLRQCRAGGSPAPRSKEGWLGPPSPSPLPGWVRCVPTGPRATALAGHGQPVGDDMMTAGGIAWLWQLWEQGAKAFPAAGAAVPDPSPHPSTRHAWGRPCNTMGGLWVRLRRGRQGSELRGMKRTWLCRGKRGLGFLCGDGGCLARGRSNPGVSLPRTTAPHGQ